MTRVFALRDPRRGDRATLDAGGARHLLACRLGPGAPLIAILGPGDERRAVVDRLNRDGAVLTLGTRLGTSGADPAGVLALAVAVADLPRLDLVIEKATELGATSIEPFRARRSQRADVPAARLSRWTRIALSASEQCGRTTPPAILPAAASLDELLRRHASSRVVAFAPERPVLSIGANPGGAAQLVVVGPEGGWTTEELRSLERGGAVLAGLGPRVLRFETAAIAGLTLVSLGGGGAGAVRAPNVGGGAAVVAREDDAREREGRPRGAAALGAPGVGNEPLE